jgi:hypothetical protein
MDSGHGVWLDLKHHILTAQITRDVVTRPAARILSASMR